MPTYRISIFHLEIFSPSVNLSVDGVIFMIDFNNWCDCTNESIGAHTLRTLTVSPNSLEMGIDQTATVVLEHYAEEEKVANALARLGKQAAAKLIEDKLPTTKNIRSGDLGEILATEWIDASSGGYSAPIKRLRWKDHREMAMRGDDVIGISQDPQTLRLTFLKTEAKSRLNLTSTVVPDARIGLDKDDGLPSAHALMFISDRLFELGNLDLSDAIEKELMHHGLSKDRVTHLLFTFSGNSPNHILSSSLSDYAGDFGQWAVGIQVTDHASFVASVYDRVIKDANHI
jgi:hypothetical protein